MRLNQALRSSVLLCVAVVAVNADPSIKRITWNEFSLAVTPRSTIRIVLPDGTWIEGAPLHVTPDVINAKITRTSNRRVHPTGSATIARESVSVVQVRSPRRAGRWVGAVVPIAAGAALAIGGAAASQGTDDVYGYIVSGAAIAAGGGIGGFFVGRAIDRRFEQFIIIPERLSSTAILSIMPCDAGQY